MTRTERASRIRLDCVKHPFTNEPAGTPTNGLRGQCVSPRQASGCPAGTTHNSSPNLTRNTAILLPTLMSYYLLLSVVANLNSTLSYLLYHTAAMERVEQAGLHEAALLIKVFVGCFPHLHISTMEHGVLQRTPQKASPHDQPLVPTGTTTIT